MTSTIKRLCLGVILFCAPTFVAADETSFDVMLGDNAMICDTPESVVTVLATNVNQPDCGLFRTTSGAPVTVTIIGEYQGPERLHPLARFDFHIETPWGNQVQYGWWAGAIPENVPQDVAL